MRCGARFDGERCDGQSGCADRRGGLRHERHFERLVLSLSKEAEKSHVVERGDPSAPLRFARGDEYVVETG